MRSSKVCAPLFGADQPGGRTGANAFSSVTGQCAVAETPVRGYLAWWVSWTFIYLMVALKIPIAALLYLVWWAIHQTPETTENGSGDGGIKRPRHPRPPLPRRPRHRGGHGMALPSPPRTRRAVLARGRPHPLPATSKHR
jgi:hypothetical protein